MSANETNYGTSHLDGDTDIRRVINPELRGSIRRSDPDGTHSQPFVSGLNGTSLTVDVSSVGNLVANFASDDWQAAIDLINGLSPANLFAEDRDGFLALRNLNGGGDNHIQIVSGDAAPLLGFILSPEPGSIAYAGEIETAPAGTYGGEANPQGTALVAADEDLRSGSVNRGMATLLLQLARLNKELDAEVPVVRELDVTISVGVGSSPFVHITDSSIRIPIDPLSISVTNPDEELFSIAAVTFPDGETIHDLGNTTEPMTRINGVFSHDGTATALDDSVSFAAWGTPDGKSIFGSTVADKDKQSSIAISGIRGNVIEATGATFQTNGVQPGDTVEITGATNTSPFLHNGEFVVVRVLDEERLQVRAKSEFEALIGSTTNRPTDLNDQGPGFGNVRVPVGNFVSAEFGISFRLVGLPNNISNGASAKLRVLTGAKLKDLSPGDMGLSLWPSPSGLAEIVRQHVATGDVAAGSSTLRHTAAQVDYAGGDAWADSTSNPAATVEAQLDKIITDLSGAGSDGAAKLRALVSGVLSAGTIRDQLDQLALEWFRLARDNTATGNNIFNGQSTFADIISAIFTGQAQLNTSDEDVASLKSADPTARRFIWDLGANTRVYLQSNSNLLISVNASWDSGTSQWSRDGGGASFLITFGTSIRNPLGEDIGSDSTGFSVAHKEDNTSSWADNEWDPLFAADADNGSYVYAPTKDTDIGALWGKSSIDKIWAACIDPQGGLFRTGFHFFDDFNGIIGNPVGNNNWNVNTAGSGSVTYTSDPPHHAKLDVTASLSDVAELIMENATPLVSESPAFRTRVSLTNGNDSRIASVGFGVSSGVFFTNDVFGNWLVQVVHSGVEDANSPVDTGVDASGLVSAQAFVLLLMISDPNTVDWIILNGDTDPVSDYGAFHDTNTLLASGTLTTASTILNSDIASFRYRLDSDDGIVDDQMYVDYADVFTLHRRSLKS